LHAVCTERPTRTTAPLLAQLKAKAAAGLGGAVSQSLPITRASGPLPPGYLLEQIVAACLGMPSFTRQADADASLPAQFDIDETGPWNPLSCLTPELAALFADRPKHAITTFRAWIELAMILGAQLAGRPSLIISLHAERIIGRLHSSKGQGRDVDLLQELTTALYDWRCRLPAHAIWPGTGSNRPQLPHVCTVHVVSPVSPFSAALKLYSPVVLHLLAAAPPHKRVGHWGGVELQQRAPADPRDDLRARCGSPARLDALLEG
jgi:hypothetical protein